MPTAAGAWAASACSAAAASTAPLLPPLPPLPLSPDDLLLSLSAKQKVQLARSQEVLRGRLLLRSYTHAAASAHYDYNVRSEQARRSGAGPLGGSAACGAAALL